MTRGDQHAFFERSAARYDRRLGRSRWPRNQRLKAELVARELEPALAGTVLEVGCGTGQVAGELVAAQPALHYVGVDFSPGMLEVARRRLGDAADLRVGRAETLPLDDASVDAAFGIDVLHHVDDPAAALRDLRRVVRPGGRVVFLEGNPRFPLTAVLGLVVREERAVLRIGPRMLMRLFVAAGFVDVSARWGPVYTPPGPAAVERVWDRVDAALAATPVARALALHVVAAGSIPRTRVPAP